MKIFLASRFLLLSIMLFTASCLTVQESPEKAELSNNSSERKSMNDNINKTNIDNHLIIGEEEVAKLNLRFGGELDIFIELVEKKYIILHYINNNDRTLLIPYFSFKIFYKGYNSGEKIATLSDTLHIVDDVGNELITDVVFADYNPYHIITEDECLKMESGDEYVLKPVSLSSLIEMEKLVGTGTEIKIYYGELEEHQSNVVTLTL